MSIIHSFPIRFCIALMSVSLLPACSGSGKRVSKIYAPVDVSNVPGATPKAEPRSKYGNPKSYTVFGKRYYVMKNTKGFSEQGVASWYGEKFHGRRTSSGETYDMYAMTAAHKTLPLPTYVQVTNIENKKKVLVKVNDRGPFHENRIIDLSYAAATKLDIVSAGTALVSIESVESANVVAGDNLTTEQVSEKTAANKDNNFYIQVGAFSNLENAKFLQQKLRNLSKNLIRIIESTKHDKVLYRVRIGPLNSIKKADNIIAKLINIGEHDHHIIFD